MEKCDGAIEHPKGHENSDSQECDQFDNRFRGYGQHQAILMFGSVDVTGAKQDGEGRHGQRYKERNVTKQRPGHFCG